MVLFKATCNVVIIMLRSISDVSLSQAIMVLLISYGVGDNLLSVSQESMTVSIVISTIGDY